MPKSREFIADLLRELPAMDILRREDVAPHPLSAPRFPLFAAGTADDDARARQPRPGESLNQRVERLKRRTAVVLESRLLAHPAARPLQRLAHDAGVILRWVDERQLADAAAGVHEPVGFFECLLHRQAELVDRLSAQFTLFESLHGKSLQLLRLAPLLQKCGGLEYRRDVVPLAEQTIAFVDRMASPLQLLPMYDWRLCVQLRERGIAHYAECTVSILAAQLLVWLTSAMPSWKDERIVMTLAALLQDVALLPPSSLSSTINATGNAAPNSKSGLPADRHPHVRAERRHPQVGAGLLAGVNGVPASLPLLIAQHHERYDGSGYPRGITHVEQFRAGRLLALVTRFVNLYLLPQHDGFVPESHCARVFDQLSREVACGCWDSELAREFLPRLEGLDELLRHPESSLQLAGLETMLSNLESAQPSLPDARLEQLKDAGSSLLAEHLALHRAEASFPAVPHRPVRERTPTARPAEPTESPARRRS